MPPEPAAQAAMFESLRRPEAEDESIRDLRRAMLAQTAIPAVVRRSSTPPNQRARSELLDPDIGRLSDVAQPGGFRRQHVRQQGVAVNTNKYMNSSLVHLLEPEVVSFLSFCQDADEHDGADGAGHHAMPVVDSTASNWSIGIYLAKCCFGSAFLIMPRGYKSAGAIGAPAILVLVYIFMVYGMLKLIDVRRAWGQPARYGDLGEALGWFGKKYITVANFALTFGFNCIWCVTCQENLQMLLQDWSPAARLWLFFPAVSLLSLVRKLELFAFTNLLGILLCAGVSIYLAVFAVGELESRGSMPIVMVNPGSDMILWVGSCGYIFECICQVLPVYEAARDKEAMPKLLLGVTSAVLSLYIVFGFLFYSAFGEDTADLATLNLPMDSLGGVVVPGLFSVVGVVTMPLNYMIMFQTYEPAVAWPRRSCARKWAKNVVRICLSAVVYAATWLGGEMLQNFLALVGGFMGMNLSLCVPGLLHLVVCKPTGFARFLDWLTIGVGAVVMAVSAYQSISTWK